ncbi:MAG: hypothetical protein LE169_03825 [Endomicrobium sp.]|nr:hypothetical protein [Endomicrobium sp.]
MKKIIYVCLCICLMSGCDKLLNKSKSETAKTDIQNAKHKNLTPSPSLTPEPTTTPRPTSRPSPPSLTPVPSPSPIPKTEPTPTPPRQQVLLYSGVVGFVLGMCTLATNAPERAIEGIISIGGCFGCGVGIWYSLGGNGIIGGLLSIVGGYILGCLGTSIGFVASCALGILGTSIHNSLSR